MPAIWLDVDAALTEVPVNAVALIDDTDFKTREEAVTYDQAGMDLVWNFVTSAGAYTQTAVTPTTGGDYDWAHQGNGMYSIEIPASGGGSINNDTEGYGWFTGFATGVLPWAGPIIGFRAAGLNDLLCDSAYSVTRGLTGTAVPAAAADAAGGLPVSDAGGLDLDAIKTVTDALPDSGALNDLASILTDTGTTVPATLATIAGYLDTEIAAIKAVTDVLPDSGALTTIAADAARLTAVRAAVLTDWINGGRLDTILDSLSGGGTTNLATEITVIEAS